MNYFIDKDVAINLDKVTVIRFVEYGDIFRRAAGECYLQVEFENGSPWEYHREDMDEIFNRILSHLKSNNKNPIAPIKMPKIKLNLQSRKE